MRHRRRPLQRLREILVRREILAPLAAALLAACAGDAPRGDDAHPGDGAPPAAAEAPGDAPDDRAPVAFTEADLDAYERGRAREIALVRAARERGRQATTPQERAAAAQAEWEDATMPGAASAAGLAEADYRALRETVDGVLETLDFQGAIDGPLSVDTARAGAELRARLSADPYAALPAPSAAALRARLPRLTALWAEYKGLTAVAG